MIALWPFIILDVLAAGYLAALALSSLLPSRRRRPRKYRAPRIAVIIPAHNEQDLLGGTLVSLQAQDYPSELYEVHVIADNCTDATAAIGRSYGAIVHERSDPARPGKGQALGWLLTRLVEDVGIDGFVFIDADSTVMPNFLTVMSRRLSAGDDVLQASYQVSDPGRSALTGLRALAFALMHDLRGRGKDRLGLSIGLWGNGMAMSRVVLASVPWQSFSAVEDGEQHIQLLLRGYKSRFVGDTRVYGHMPSTFGASKEQQQRWEGGKVFLVKRYWAPLLRRALSRLSPACGAAFFELLLPPLSVQTLLTLSIVPFTVVLGSSLQLALVCGGLAGLAVYVTSGLIAARMPLSVYASLLYAPVYLGWKVWLFATQLPKRAGPAWMRTTRDA